MAATYEKELSVAKGIARQAGETIKKYFNADQQVTRKADKTPVTIADTEINRFVIEELSKHFDDGIIGEEESTAEYGMGRRWICDPLDGTAGFTYGLPTAMFSLALVVDGRPMLGVAYDPFLDLLYEGRVGSGSYCNGERLRVSSKELNGEYVVLSSSIKRMLTEPLLAQRMLDAGARVEIFHGAVYKACLVARGKVVAHVTPTANPHDIAATHVIVEEAGGRVTSFDGKIHDFSRPFKGALISNGVVHEELLQCLK